MATTGIWKISKRLDHVLDYTANVEKTLNSEYGVDSYKELHNVIDYATADYKTEKQYYVSGINCTVETAIQEMKITKKQYSKEDGILGFHAFQSFAEGEVTPEVAHAVGVRLAEEMWGDRFEVVVSTHLNTNHIHNHFVLNSVSFIDGKRYYDKRETYAELRRLSDFICEEMGLSVLEEKPCKRSKINYSNYYQNNIDKSNYHTIAKADIDRAIAQAYSYKDFENLLEVMDYKLYYRANKLSIRRYPYKKNIRIERCFGEDYSIERIKERIEATEATRIPFIEAYGSKRKHYIVDNKEKIKHKGIYGLYLHYCYLLKIFPNVFPSKRIPPSMRLDVEKMEIISNESRLLVSNQIETYEQFLLYKTSKIKELNGALDSRSKLWYRHKRASTSEEKEIIRTQINELSLNINQLKEVMKLCEGIEDRLPQIKSNLEEIELEENRKER